MTSRNQMRSLFWLVVTFTTTFHSGLDLQFAAAFSQVPTVPTATTATIRTRANDDNKRRGRGSNGRPQKRQDLQLWLSSQTSPSTSNPIQRQSASTKTNSSPHSHDSTTTASTDKDLHDSLVHACDEFKHLDQMLSLLEEEQEPQPTLTPRSMPRLHGKLQRLEQSLDNFLFNQEWLANATQARAAATTYVETNYATSNMPLTPPTESVLANHPTQTRVVPTTSRTTTATRTLRPTSPRPTRPTRPVSTVTTATRVPLASSLTPWSSSPSTPSPRRTMTRNSPDNYWTRIDWSAVGHQARRILQAVWTLVQSVWKATREFWYEITTWPDMVDEYDQNVHHLPRLSLLPPSLDLHPLPGTTWNHHNNNSSTSSHLM